MNTRYLLFFLSTLLLLPWLIFAFAGTGIVGMPAERADVLFAGDSDVFDGVWHFWSVRTSLDNGQDPRISDIGSLVWHNIGWPDVFLSFITGFSYNMVLFIGTLFSALAGYLLARSWGIGKAGSLVAGFIIAWMPLRLVRVYQHYMLASAGFVILSLFGVRRVLLETDKKYSILLLLTSFLALMESLYSVLIIAVGFLITAILTKNAGMKRVLFAALALSLGAALALLWFFTAPEAFSTNPSVDWKEAVHWAAEPQWFILPSFLGEPLVLDTMPNPFEGVVSPGLTVALLALIYTFRKKSWVALLCAGGIVILSMGPLLKICGRPTAIPLPYMVITRLPFLSAARSPARLSMITGLMAALAAGKLIESRKSVLAWGLIILMAVELVPLKLRTIDDTVPSCYTESWESLPVTLEIPASKAIRRYSMFQIADGAPRLIGFLARGGEWQEKAIPPSLLWNSEFLPTEEDMINSGARRIIYNRWMFEDSIQEKYDSLYTSLFTEDDKSDSVWVWMSP